MGNRIDLNIDFVNAIQNKSSTVITTADYSSFADVYEHMKEQRVMAANRVTESAKTQITQPVHSATAQLSEASSHYASVYAPDSDEVFVPRIVDLLDPKATLEKLEILEKEVMEKGKTGFFCKMSDKESFSYLYDRYAETFGVNFLDHGWQHWAMNRTPNESDVAKNAVTSSFALYTQYARNNLFEAAARTQWYDEYYANVQFKAADEKAYIESFAHCFGYGNLSAEERYQAILSDYNASGDRSYAAAYKMLWLLGNTGAVDRDMTYQAAMMLDDKQDREYAALDMTVVDMAKSRYANSYYGFDAAAYLLGMMDYIQHAKETSIVFNYDPQTIAFFEKLAVDLTALGGVLEG